MAENDNLEFKKRSRRRLVGATALALVAAIILPMVMDDEPGLPVQDIQVTIPDRDADSRLARPIGGRPAVVDESPVAPAPQETPPGTTVLSPEEGADEPSAQVPPRRDALERTPDIVTPPAGSGVAAAPPARPRTSETPRPTPAPPTATDDEASRVRAILEGRVAAPSASAQSFFVQAGAFSEASKASAFSNDLKARGFESFTEPAGAVTRVRVGPYASREEAERVVGRLSAIGISGVVTTR